MLLQAIQVFATPIDVTTLTDQRHNPINPYTDVLITDQPIELDHIYDGRFNHEFSPLENLPAIYVGFNNKHYWFRIILHNSSETRCDLNLLLGQLSVRKGDLYQVHNSTITHLGTTGYQYPFESRPYPYPHYIYPFSLQANTIDTLYLTTDESHAYRLIALGLLYPKELKKMEAKFYFLYGSMTGILILFFLFNFYLFLVSKDSVHFWYASYVLVQCFLLIKHEGLDAQFLGMDSVFGYRFLSMGGVGALSIVLLMQVLQLFFKHKTKDTIIYKIMKYIKTVLFVSALVFVVIFNLEVHYQIEQLVFGFMNLILIVGLITIFIFCIYNVMQGSKPGILVLIGLAIFLIGGLERVLMLPYTSFLYPLSLFQIGVVAETIVISFGLMYKYQLYKKEKDQIESALRIRKIREIKKIINSQEQERKRIAEDIHDDVSSNLAILKLHLESLESDELNKKTLINLVDKTSRHIRQVSHDLMPPEFENTDFHTILDAYVKQLNNTSSVRFEYINIGHGDFFNKEEELMIYRIILELVNNILKHSKADTAIIQLLYDDYSFQLLVEDNGVGFQSEDITGIGLKNIRTRVEFLKGKMHIDTGENGTTVIVEIPLSIDHLKHIKSE